MFSYVSAVVDYSIHNLGSTFRNDVRTAVNKVRSDQNKDSIEPLVWSSDEAARAQEGLHLIIELQKKKNRETECSGMDCCGTKIGLGGQGPHVVSGRSTYWPYYESENIAYKEGGTATELFPPTLGKNAVQKWADEGKGGGHYDAMIRNSHKILGCALGTANENGARVCSIVICRFARDWVSTK